MHESEAVPDEEADEPELRLEDDGEYDIILPLDSTAASSSSASSPPRDVPPHILRPPYARGGISSRIKQFAGDVFSSPVGDGAKIKLGGTEEAKLRRAAKLAKRTLEYARSLVAEGTTTDEIDAKVHEFIIFNKAYPSPLLYRGFPKSCCTSVNNIMVHGIPDSRPLRNGDIINIDITVYLEGYHGDTSKTFLVGDVDATGRDLVSTTEAALEAAIAACAAGKPFRDIGRAIWGVVKDKNVSVSPAFTGHGIGSVFHTRPWIIHSVNHEPGVMQVGDCFTIEPCIVIGSNAEHMVFPDDWTASSTNWARAAQAEHMVLITPDGAEVLTR